MSDLLKPNSDNGNEIDPPIQTKENKDEQQKLDDEYEMLVLEVQSIASNPQLIESNKITGTLNEKLERLRILKTEVSQDIRSRNTQKLIAAYQSLEEAEQPSKDNTDKPTVPKTEPKPQALNETPAADNTKQESADTALSTTNNSKPKEVTDADIEGYQRKLEALQRDPNFTGISELQNQLTVLFNPRIRQYAGEEDVRKAIAQLEKAYETHAKKTTEAVQTPERKLNLPNTERIQTVAETFTQAEIDEVKKAYVDHFGQDVFDQPKQSKLIPDLESNNPRKVAKAVSFMRNQTEMAKEQQQKSKKEQEIFAFKIKRGFYSRLGLNPDASADEIQTAYRKLSRQFNQDTAEGMNLSPRAIEKAKAIQRRLNEAYEVLSNEQRKEQYDLSRPTNRTEATNQKPFGTGPFDEFFNNIFTGTTGFQTASSFEMKPPTPKTPEQKRQDEIRRLESNIRTAKNIVEILNSLKKLKKLDHVFEFTDSQSWSTEKGFGKIRVSPEEIINQISATVKNIYADGAIFEASISAITEKMGIQSKVRRELENRKSAFDTLKKIDANQWDILQALRKLLKMADQINVTIDGKSDIVILKTEMDNIKKIKNASSRPLEVNNLIVNLTSWRDIDLKIYYDIREKSYNQSKWKSVPIPDAIKIRYEKYKEKRNPV